MKNDLVFKIKKLREIIGHNVKYYPASKTGYDHAEVYEKDAKYYLYTCSFDRSNNPTARATSEISEEEYLKHLKILHTSLYKQAQAIVRDQIIQKLVTAELKHLA